MKPLTRLCGWFAELRQQKERSGLGHRFNGQTMRIVLVNSIAYTVYPICDCIVSNH